MKDGEFMATRYRYNIELRYLYNDKEVIIDSSNIKNQIINYDYINNNTPVILLKVALDKNMIDDMIKNHKTKYITLKITKYEYDSSFRIDKNYINDQFVYYLDTNNLNTNKDLDYSTTTANSKDLYKIVTIGLVKQSLIDNNKILINGFFNNKPLIDILLCYLSHMKLLIEPLADNVPLGNILIPPIASVSEFLKYIDSQYSIYDTRYRFFIDIDRTYLLSSSGTAVQAKNEDYYIVIFNVSESSSLQSKNQGMYIDKTTKSYMIDLDTTDINPSEDIATNKIYDTVIGIDSNGTTKTVTLTDSVTSGNTRIERTNNLNQIDALQNNIDNNKMIVNIVKTELDTTVFTMNKEYYIKNYNRLPGNSGKFVLTSKKEIYARDEESFIVSLILTFNKVKS